MDVWPAVLCALVPFCVFLLFYIAFDLFLIFCMYICEYILHPQ